MSKQANRSEYAHFIDITPETNTPTWVREGVGLESFEIGYNPQRTSFKTIIDEVAQTMFEGYQMETGVSDKRIYRDDELYTFLNDARIHAKAIETNYLEVDTKDEISDGEYRAQKFKILITIESALGDSAVISYNIDYQGSPINGSVSISNGEPTFTESAD